MDNNQFNYKQNEQPIKNKKTMLSIIGVAVLVIGLVGVTYAFFNYTRTGVSNTIRVGRISFTSSQTETINLTNVFPINRNNVSTDTTNTDDVVITIEGDTEYSDGVEYLVTAIDVTNTVNNKPVPISINVTVGNGLGTSDSSYFTNRGSSASTHIYKVLEDEVLYDNQELLVGYIKNSTTGINGTITIRAFLDDERIGISDTYDGTESDNMGTTEEWARGRSILTTTEWNSLQTSGVSFKIKVEANEGIWVEEVFESTPTQYFKTLRYKRYTYNEGRTSNDIAACVALLQEWEFDDVFQDGETMSDFCAGTGTMDGGDLETVIITFEAYQLLALQKTNILKYSGEDLAIIGYDTQGGTNVVIPKYLPVMVYSYNNSRSASDVTNCTTYFNDNNYSQVLETGETIAAFCEGTGKMHKLTFQEWLDSNYFGVSALNALIDMGIVNQSTGTTYFPVTRIGYGVFSSYNLTSVIIPDSVEFIEPYAFYNNRLTNIKLPKNLMNIGLGSFAYNQLSRISIPKKTKGIYSSAFYSNQLSSITIPLDSELEFIAGDAFSRNSNLTQLVVPDAIYAMIQYSCDNQDSYGVVDSGVVISNMSGTQSCTAQRSG